MRRWQRARGQGRSARQEYFSSRRRRGQGYRVVLFEKSNLTLSKITCKSVAAALNPWIDPNANGLEALDTKE